MMYGQRYTKITRPRQGQVVEVINCLKREGGEVVYFVDHKRGVHYQWDREHFEQEYRETP